MNNHEYAMSKVYELEHHIEEIKGALEGMNDTEAWMIGRLERASLDLSDVTHTLLSEEEEPEAYESDANDNFEEEAEEEVEDVTED